MRPKFICHAFTHGSPTASMLLEELYYWQQYSDIEKKGDKVVIHSYEDWMRLTGLTLAQFRSAIKRLKDNGIVWTYNSFSKFHCGRKCLHIAVKKSWCDEYHRLRRQDYLQNELYGFTPYDLYEMIQTYILEKEAEENQVVEQEFKNQGQALPKDKTLGESEHEYVNILEEMNYKHHDLWLQLFKFYYPEYAGFDLGYKHKKQLDELSKVYDFFDKSFCHVMRMIFIHWEKYLVDIEKKITVMPLIRNKPSLDFIHANAHEFLKLAVVDLKFSKYGNKLNGIKINEDAVIEPQEIKLKAKKSLV
jgi:hypothetical protein